MVGETRNRSRSASEHSHTSPRKVSSRPVSRNKQRTRKQETFPSHSSSPTKETKEQNGQVPENKFVLSEEIESILKTPKKNDNIKQRNVNEESQGVSNVVEQTLGSIFQQIDKAMDDSARKIDGNLSSEEEQIPKTPGSTIRVASTRSSKLRKKSARSRLEMYKNLPPGRQEEYQVYAGDMLRAEQKKREKSRKKN